MQFADRFDSEVLFVRYILRWALLICVVIIVAAILGLLSGALRGEEPKLAPPVPPKAFSEVQALKAENMDLREAMLQSEYGRLQTARASLRSEICAAAAIPDVDCNVIWQQKMVARRMTMPTPKKSPETKKPPESKK